MYNLRMYSRIGRRNPLYSTAIGKVLLAWRDRSEVEQILDGVEYKRSTERTITSTEELLKCWMAFASRAMARIMRNRKRAALHWRAGV